MTACLSYVILKDYKDNKITIEEAEGIIKKYGHKDSELIDKIELLKEDDSELEVEKIFINEIRDSMEKIT